MRTFPVNTDSIQVGERHRALNEDAVGRLQASLKELGLQQPISIRIVGGAGAAVLVAGRHRLEAARRLGWHQIDCIEVGDDDLRAEMWEIAENLHRCDLTKDQRDEHIRRYAEILEAIEVQKAEAERQAPQTAAAVLSDGRRKGPQHEKGIARQIAEATGLSDDTVRRALKPARPTKRPVSRPALSAAGKQLAALRKAWRAASPAVREHFLTEVNERKAA